MKASSCAITEFEIIRPKYEKLQSSALEWIYAAHCKAEELKGGKIAPEIIKEKLWRVACKPHVIHKRGHEIPDFCHLDWDKMQIYRILDFPEGACLEKRQEVHGEIVDSLFERFYPEGCKTPDEIVHVTCTGYASPSGAQKIISKKGWKGTQATHLYHMGCYAAIPALRIAEGLIANGGQTDIVHTELCTLHHNPLSHDAHQFVVQSLFADGFIKYALLKRKKIKDSPSLVILGTHEEIIPESLDLMGWHLSNCSFQFTLSNEIPVYIARYLEEYLKNLSEKCNVDQKQILKEAIFAVHPGGPKILDYIQRFLNLNDDQLTASRNILSRYGNMSSATLPHIWHAILHDPKVSSSKIVSLAFGPGLTLAGAILEKHS